jgi:hypothetical protein
LFGSAVTKMFQLTSEHKMLPRKLCNEEIQHLYSAPSAVRKTEFRRPTKANVTLGGHSTNRPLGGVSSETNGICNVHSFICDLFEDAIIIISDDTESNDKLIKSEVN